MLLKIDQIDLSPLKKNQSWHERKKNSIIPLPASHNHFWSLGFTKEAFSVHSFKRVKEFLRSFFFFFSPLVWQHGTQHLYCLYGNKGCKSKFQDHENIISNNLKFSMSLLLPNRLSELLSFTYILIYFWISCWLNETKWCEIHKKKSITNHFSVNPGKLKADVGSTPSPKCPQQDRWIHPSTYFAHPKIYSDVHSNLWEERCCL